MTEVFGLCGTGWGFGGLSFEQHGDNVACIGSVWYKEDLSVIEQKYVHAVGDAVVRNGNVAEAYKKAQTNLLSKASSFIGVGLSVYKGEGHDDPYKDRAGNVPAPPQPVAPAPVAPVTTPPPAATVPAASAPVAGEPPQPANSDTFFKNMPTCSQCGHSGWTVRKDSKTGGHYCWSKIGGCGNTNF